MSVLLLYPPTAKICEPPPGIAMLAGSLKRQGVSCASSDLNLSCLLDLIHRQGRASDTWSLRALKHRNAHLAELRSWSSYGSPDRYRRAVRDLNRILAIAGRPGGWQLSLTNCTRDLRSPLCSDDLLEAAEHFEENPFFDSFSRRLEHLLDRHDPSVLGLSLSFLSQAFTGFAILGYLHRHHPGLTRAVGGSLISSWLRLPDWQNPFDGLIDHLIEGPGEVPLAHLAGAPPPERPGPPDYSQLELSRYLAPGPIIPYSGSTGCYWNRCTFCPDRAEAAPYQAVPPDRAVLELAGLAMRYQPALLHLVDNAVSPSLLRRLTRHPPGCPWYGFARIEPALEDLQFCRELRRSGCVMLKLGVESGSQRVLDRLEKGIALTRVSRVLSNLERAGIASYVYLLFGTPAETKGDAEMTLDFVRNHSDRITFLNVAIFNMPVCSPEGGDVARRFSGDDLSLYSDFHHPNGWDRRAVRAFLQERFRREPQISRILQRDPPFFTSNHAPLLLLARPAPKTDRANGTRSSLPRPVQSES